MASTTVRLRNSVIGTTGSGDAQLHDDRGDQRGDRRARRASATWRSPRRTAEPASETQTSSGDTPPVIRAAPR